MNEYVQASKANEVSVETLYADLQHRLHQVMSDWGRFDRERTELKADLASAKASLAAKEAELEQARTALNECKGAAASMAKAKARAMRLLEAGSAFAEAAVEAGNANGNATASA